MVAKSYSEKDSRMDDEGTGSATTMGSSILSRSSSKDNDLAASYQQMLQMTLELVQDIYLNIRPGDRILTTFGPGVLKHKETIRLDGGGGGRADSINQKNHNANHSTSTSTSSVKMTIELPFGILYSPQSDLIHKLLTTTEYEQAMDHLEQTRKLQLALQCQEWGISMREEETCVACLFQKPELYASKRRRQRRRYWRSSSSSNDSSAQDATTDRCDVCGNPVCSQHKMSMGGQHEYFTMCVDCSHDLNQAEHPFQAHHHTQTSLLANLQRLHQYYIRMSLQLCFCVPNLMELSHRLTHKQRRDGAISLGNSALGFVGAALGVVGAAAMLTPAGPALILAAVATSATSGTFQGMHASYNMFLSNKTAHQLADRCLGWHGLCLGILNALERIRQDLIAQKTAFQQSQAEDGKGNGEDGKNGDDLQSGRRLATLPQQSLDVWNVLAVGSFTTTRNAMTGVGVTSAMGASYSQAINTSLQGIPVVGAAFSVGCMAMDANNMASSMKLLNTPAKTAVALQGVHTSFAKHVPTTIAPEVTMIQQGIDDLQYRMADHRHEQERALIERELEGLVGLGDGYNSAGATTGLGEYESDDALERELQGL